MLLKYGKNRYSRSFLNTKRLRTPAVGHKLKELVGLKYITARYTMIIIRHFLRVLMLQNIKKHNVINDKVFFAFICFKQSLKNAHNFFFKFLQVIV